MRSSLALAFASLLLASAPAWSQQNPPVPKPFPQPAQGEPAAQAPAQQPPAKPAGTEAAKSDTAVPTEQTLGVQIYPDAQFLTSYDAGQGQRYYLFGTDGSFADVVAFYRNALKNRGDLVFEEPPVHEFDIGKFKEETMAFPPSVTVKDYTWGGMPGYLAPTPDGQSRRFKTIIQIVPNPPQQ